MNENKNYEYPLDEAWTTAEIITVTNFYQAVEAANEGGIDREDFLKAHEAFLQVVPSKAENKQIDRAFATASGYSIYRTVQAATNETGKRVRVTPNERS